jgi:replication protein
MQVSGLQRGFAALADLPDKAGRDGRYVLREGLWKVGGDQALRGCGKSVLAGGVTPMAKGGTVYYAGVATCGKVHLCPCCGAKVRAARSDELQRGGTAWECDGCGLAMLTLTMRHYERQALRTLVDQQRDAWKLSFGMNAGRTWRAAKPAFGIEGYVRAWECTHGENGWHPHYHVLFFVTKPWTATQGEDFEALAFELWSAALTKVGAYMPDRAHGVRLDIAGRGEGGTLSRYLMKFQDGKAGWSVGDEMTRQDIKEGREGHRTPFQIARDFLATGEARDFELWREFEAGAFNIRALYWSNGMRARLGMLVELDERTDAEIAAEKVGGDPLAVIPAEIWYRAIVRWDGRSLALIRAAESLGEVGIRTLIESWGLVWGRDVLPAPVAEDAETGPSKH